MPRAYVSCREAGAVNAVDELILILRAQTGDVPAMDELTLLHLPCIERTARSFWCPGLSFGELRNDGVIAFRGRAVPNFDPQYGARLWAYAQRVVRTSMRDACAKWYGLSSNASGHFGAVLDSFNDLAQQYEREPTPEEVARNCNLPEKVVREVLELGRDVPLEGSEDEDEDDKPPRQLPGNEVPTYGRAVWGASYKKVIDVLGPEEGVKWLVMFAFKEAPYKWAEFARFVGHPSDDGKAIWEKVRSDLPLPSDALIDWAHICALFATPPPLLTEEDLRQWYSRRRRTLQALWRDD